MSGITNLIGNGVATIVVSRWEKELDKEVLNANLRKPKSVVDLTQEEVAEHTPPLTPHKPPGRRYARNSRATKDSKVQGSGQRKPKQIANLISVPLPEQL